jgi:hypothetical protein
LVKREVLGLVEVAGRTEKRGDTFGTGGGHHDPSVDQYSRAPSERPEKPIQPRMNTDKHG